MNDDKRLRIRLQLTERARQFRRELTPMEAQLWQHLRDRTARDTSFGGRSFWTGTLRIFIALRRACWSKWTAVRTMAQKSAMPSGMNGLVCTVTPPCALPTGMCATTWKAFLSSSHRPALACKQQRKRKSRIVSSPGVLTLIRAPRTFSLRGRRPVCSSGALDRVLTERQTHLRLRSPRPVSAANASGRRGR